MAKKDGARAEGHPPPQGQQGSDRKPPAVEFRIGRIRATVWENSHPEKGKWFSITLTRSYKDNQGQWRTASSFGRDDLLAVGEVTRMAFHWINREYGGGQRDPQQPNGPAHEEDSGSSTDGDIPF
jgi:hypothetical protein